VGAFGDKLRKQREQRGIELDAISNTTKISARMLRAIEEERFDLLPGGVFNKGFIRAYARQVGLDEEEAVTDYLTALRESQIQAQTVTPDFRSHIAKPSPPAGAPNYRPPKPNDRLPSGPGHNGRHNPPAIETSPSVRRQIEDHRSGAPSLDALNLDHRGTDRRVEDRRGDVRRSDAHNSDAGSKPEPPTPTQPPAVPDSIPATPADDSSAGVRWKLLVGALLALTLALAFWSLRHRAAASPPAASSHPSPAPESAPVIAQAAAPSPAKTPLAAAPVRTTPNPGSTSHPPATPASQSAPANTPAPTPSADVNPPESVKAVVHAPTTKSPPAFTLVIRAVQTSWVSITSDGQPVAHETLIAPANTSVHANREIVVKTGNAAGISFLLNGKEIPASGDPGEVRVYIFDATGVKSSATVQTSNPQP
jgi:cytoskeletal protein RodZ